MNMPNEIKQISKIKQSLDYKDILSGVAEYTPLEERLVVLSAMFDTPQTANVEAVKNLTYRKFHSVFNSVTRSKAYLERRVNEVVEFQQARGKYLLSHVKQDEDKGWVKQVEMGQAVLVDLEYDLARVLNYKQRKNHKNGQPNTDLQNLTSNFYAKYSQFFSTDYLKKRLGGNYESL